MTDTSTLFTFRGPTTAPRAEEVTAVWDHLIPSRGPQAWARASRSTDRSTQAQALAGSALFIEGLAQGSELHPFPGTGSMELVCPDRLHA